MPEMVRVMVLVDGMYLEGEPLNIGERVEIPDDLVADWLRGGLARLGWEEGWGQKNSILTRASSLWR